MSCRSLTRVRALFLICAALAGVAFTGAPSRANPYESFLDVETEQDLYDALSVRQISSDTFERLLDLLARGVDLEVASRQELYELPNLTYGEVDAILAYRGARAGGGGLGDGSGLVAAGVLEEQRYLAIAPFLLVRSSAPGLGGVRGWGQAQARASLQDRGAPPLGVRVRAAGFGWLTAGVAAAVTRQRLDDVRYDPNRQALLAGDPELRVQVPKAYLRWEDERYALLLGSYRAGFGQRLVFDDSGAEQPVGFVIDDQLVSGGGATRACKLAAGELPSPCAGEDSAGAARVTPDVRWREALFGVAASAKRLPLGAGWLALHAWGSYAERAVYQYELLDRGRCADPRRDADLACAAPAVLRRPEGELLEPATGHAYQTLPAMFVEALAGGNATYWLDRRTRAGVTAYTARADDLVGGVALGTQEGARWPGGQRFGALGAEAALGREGLEVGAEVARSFDELPRAPGLSAGGGLGAVLRVALSRQHEETSGAGGAPLGGGGTELELTARYYQATFVNPYARPVAAADELEGQRARDEAGVRARASTSWPRGAARATVDGWINPTTGTPRLASDLRVERQAGPRLRWGVAFAFDDKDLAHGGRDECFEGSRSGGAGGGLADAGDDEGGGGGNSNSGNSGSGSADGGSLPCRGMKLSSSGRLTASLSSGLELTAQAQHELLDSGGAGGDEPEQRLALWLVGRWRSASGTRVRVQLRHREEGLGEGGTRTFTGAVEVRLGLGVASRLSLRLDGQLELPRASEDRPSARALALGVSYDVEL